MIAREIVSLAELLFGIGGFWTGTVALFVLSVAVGAGLGLGRRLVSRRAQPRRRGRR